MAPPSPLLNWIFQSIFLRIVKFVSIGLCKSKWEKRKTSFSGNYEYIDVNMNENRYIIEVNLAREFDIRPAACYTSLLEIFLSIFVGKVKELKQVELVADKYATRNSFTALSNAESTALPNVRIFPRHGLVPSRIVFFAAIGEKALQMINPALRNGCTEATRAMAEI
ncbi:hypothetical protein HAX54_024896 [Datura stramonium]|uniref:Uncharacterized protein n=1 Tax=Datura stramonium TaxID=4076 RepID=A0ABS8S698_DATST|nr:hypothetical protein [Datura stramonium]